MLNVSWKSGDLLGWIYRHPVGGVDHMALCPVPIMLVAYLRDFALVLCFAFLLQNPLSKPPA